MPSGIHRVYQASCQDCAQLRSACSKHTSLALTACCDWRPCSRRIWGWLPDDACETGRRARVLFRLALVKELAQQPGPRLSP